MKALVERQVRAALAGRTTSTWCCRDKFLDASGLWISFAGRDAICHTRYKRKEEDE